MDIYIEKQQITVVLLCILMLNLSIFLLSILPFLLLKKEVEKVNDSIFRVAYWLLEATKPKWAIDKLHKLMTNKKWVAILIYTIVAVFIFYFIIVGWVRYSPFVGQKKAQDKVKSRQQNLKLHRNKEQQKLLSVLMRIVLVEQI